MSVLVKEMEMPIDCKHCRIALYDEVYGTICPFSGIAFEVDGKRQKTCPLVEVPSDEETQKKGKWISFGEYKMGRYAGWICSNCETFFDDSKANLYIRCPKCGAYMEE